MRRLTLTLLGLALLFTATAVLAAEPVATDGAAPASALATTVAPPALIDQILEPSPSAITPICPPEPVVSCNSCFLFGTTTSFQCTLFCSNGVLHRSCSPCGTGCPL
ncbi:MAG TPA: hypothetical protein VF173_26550 [Thermoanaerobaculia bacterium]|nr:hypothetical protein [Thermoanaerobaculia bacterium]